MGKVEKAPDFIAGHPSVTKEVWDSVLELLREGHGLKRICRQHPKWPARSTFLAAVASTTKEMQDTYARACTDGADGMVDDAMDIADDSRSDTEIRIGKDGLPYEACDHEWIARSKLRVDQRRWHASKLNPKKYGDKLHIEDTTPPVPDDELDQRIAARLAKAGVATR